ncbi:MAG: transglycosylase domain-containing protein [Kouleothrix sp.]
MPANSLQGRLDTLQKHQGFQTSRIYDRHGTLLYEFFDAGKRTRVPLYANSPLLIATISIEDKTFFKNSGVDYEGIMKAAYQSGQCRRAWRRVYRSPSAPIKQAVLTEAEKAPGESL